MRVLVVEDETRMSRLLKRGLEEEGHAVDLAADGPEGLWLASENRRDRARRDAAGFRRV
jgi:DNA-binding response OmpR family regulator